MKSIVYFTEAGVKVTVAPMAKPRANEKTFRNNKFSIYNQGRQAVLFGRKNCFATVDCA